MQIRQITLKDAEEYLSLRNAVDTDSEFMLYEKGERATTVEGQRNIIFNYLNRANSNIFVVEDEGNLVGFLEAQGSYLKKIKHKTFIVLGLLREYRGKGLGKQLFIEMENWAREKKLHRLELIFMEGNKVGRHLYEKWVLLKREGVKMYI
ncbi:MAG: GNAT family N-acetyltransferase [Candidatus Dojkabacteria bacterium]|nr:GNAT family N-acetyltransferase [Candidatus Dojkabacteria bacterium]